MAKHKSFWVKTKLSTDFSLASEKNYFTNTCLGHLTDKITTGFEKSLFTGVILIDLGVWDHWSPNLDKEKNI